MGATLTKTLIADASPLSPNLPSRKVFDDIYELQEEIGKGAFARVFKCRRYSDNQCFAVKTIHKSNLTNQELIRLRSEIYILKMKLGSTPHPNIIQLVDIFDHGETLFMVLELCNPHDLYDRIADSKQCRLSEPEAAYITLQLCNGIEFLHQKGVVHRDLKPGNVLFGRDYDCESNPCRAIICDFGLASEELSNLQDTCGSPHFLAPELINRQYYNYKVDYFALGVILYFMLVGYYPFDGDTLPDIYKQISNGNYDMKTHRWHTISKDAKHLIHCLLQKDVNQRYDAQQIRNHIWIQRHHHHYHFDESYSSMSGSFDIVNNNSNTVAPTTTATATTI